MASEIELMVTVLLARFERKKLAREEGLSYKEIVSVLALSVE